MNLLTVWAPRAGRVEVLVGKERRPARRLEGGWWGAERPGPGIDYRFSLDGKAPLKDPRSAWQPEGISGPSRILDHGAFRWSDAGFRAPPLGAGLIYELHVGTFTPEGTFDAVTRHLDHLLQLGVTHVELLPVNGFSGTRGWGYDGVDLYAPHAAYGPPDSLKRLVDECHRRGLAVLLDVVYNHLGPEGNVLHEYGPYFTDRYHTPWGPAVNLDGAGCDGARRFIVDNALMWLRDYHFDGLRIDAIHAFLDTGATHLLEQMSTEVEALEASLGRPLVLIAESDLNDPRVVRARESGGHGMHAQWSDDFHHALHTILTGERAGYYEDFGQLVHLADALHHAFVYGGRYSPHRDRTHGRPATGLSGHRFLGYLQNHDQVGNRAQGERMSALVSPARVKIGAALVLTAPFVPMLFMGEEWGASTPFQYFTSHESKELGEAVRNGRRSEFAAFGWKPEEVPDPQDPATFERSRLRWEELGREPHASLLAWHQALVKLRRAEPDLTDGRLEQVEVMFDDAARWFRVRRGRIVVAVNFGPEPRSVPLPGPVRVLLASEDAIRAHENRVELPPDTVLIGKLG